VSLVLLDDERAEKEMRHRKLESFRWIEEIVMCCDGELDIKLVSVGDDPQDGTMVMVTIDGNSYVGDEMVDALEAAAHGEEAEQHI